MPNQSGSWHSGRPAADARLPSLPAVLQAASIRANSETSRNALNRIGHLKGKACRAVQPSAASRAARPVGRSPSPASRASGHPRHNVHPHPRNRLAEPRAPRPRHSQAALEARRCERADAIGCPADSIGFVPSTGDEVRQVGTCHQDSAAIVQLQLERIATDNVRHGPHTSFGRAIAPPVEQSSSVPCRQEIAPPQFRSPASP